jgi:hypothetical protein
VASWIAPLQYLCPLREIGTCSVPDTVPGDYPVFVLPDRVAVRMEIEPTRRKLIVA